MEKATRGVFSGTNVLFVPPIVFPALFWCAPGLKCLVHHVVLWGLCGFLCQSTVHYQAFAWLVLYFNTVSFTYFSTRLLVWQRSSCRYCHLFIWFSKDAILKQRSMNPWFCFASADRRSARLLRGFVNNTVAASFDLKSKYEMWTLHKEHVWKGTSVWRFVFSIITNNLYLCCHATQMTCG